LAKQWIFSRPFSDAAPDDLKSIPSLFLHFSSSATSRSLLTAPNGDKIYDFIVIFSIKANRFPSTLNPFVIVFFFRVELIWMSFSARGTLLVPILAMLPIQFRLLLLRFFAFFFLFPSSDDLNVAQQISGNMNIERPAAFGA
jgi:hypothetical protein